MQSEINFVKVSPHVRIKFQEAKNINDMFDNKLQVTKEIVEESVSYIGQ
jgi:hypothetical protein